MEWAICNYDNNSGVFSTPGDSGLIMVHGLGRIGSLLTGGTGRAETLDVTYATHMWWLWPRTSPTPTSTRHHGLGATTTSTTSSMLASCLASFASVTSPPPYLHAPFFTSRYLLDGRWCRRVVWVVDRYFGSPPIHLVFSYF